MNDPARRTPPAGAELRARQPQAVHSALTVLEEVARCGPGVTARQVSENLAMPRATTYRLINLLVQDEYLVRMPDLQGFTLGRKVIELAHLVAPAEFASDHVVSAPVADLAPPAARTLVRELRAGIRGGIHLVRYVGDTMFVADADPDFPITDERRLLSEYGASAVGRLLLAERSPGVAGAAAGAPTPADRVGIDIDDAGRARQVDSFSLGFGCIALPIRRPDGELTGGLALSAPRIRIEAPGALLQQLESGARRLAPLLA